MSDLGGFQDIHEAHGHTKNPFSWGYFKYHSTLIMSFILLALIWYCIDNILDLIFPQKWYWYVLMFSILLMYFYFFHTTYLIS